MPHLICIHRQRGDASVTACQPIDHFTAINRDDSRATKEVPPSACTG